MSRAVRVHVHLYNIFIYLFIPVFMYVCTVYRYTCTVPGTVQYCTHMYYRYRCSCNILHTLVNTRVLFLLLYMYLQYTCCWVTCYMYLPRYQPPGILLLRNIFRFFFYPVFLRIFFFFYRYNFFFTYMPFPLHNPAKGHENI